MKRDALAAVEGDGVEDVDMLAPILLTIIFHIIPVATDHDDFRTGCLNGLKGFGEFFRFSFDISGRRLAYFSRQFQVPGAKVIALGSVADRASDFALTRLVGLGHSFYWEHATQLIDIDHQLQEACAKCLIRFARAVADEVN